MGQCKMKLYASILFLAVLTACDNSGSSMPDYSRPIELALNFPVQKMLKDSHVEFSSECMSGLDLCWYKIKNSANSKNLPSVALKSATGTLELDNVINITVIVDERVGEAVENIKVTLRGLPDNSTHEDSMGFISQLIGRVKNSGWKHYYFPSNPRISGSQAAKIMTPDKVLGRPVLGHPWLDPDYKPDLEQWLKTSVYEWYFYNDGAYLSVNARRNDSKDNPTKTGTYLITMEFLTERQYWVSDFDEDKDRANWKELLPARLKKYQDARRDIEDKARAEGIEIDESYQDPPIKALSR